MNPADKSKYFMELKYLGLLSSESINSNDFMSMFSQYSGLNALE